MHFNPISLKIALKFVPRFQITIFQYWFRLWLGADQATSHYMNLCWLVYWRIFASLGVNELIYMEQTHSNIFYYSPLIDRRNTSKELLWWIYHIKCIYIYMLWLWYMPFWLHLQHQTMKYITSGDTDAISLAGIKIYWHACFWGIFMVYGAAFNGLLFDLTIICDNGASYLMQCIAISKKRLVWPVHVHTG